LARRTPTDNIHTALWNKNIYHSVAQEQEPRRKKEGIILTGKGKMDSLYPF
jgi:hypothetical protein